MSEQNLVPIDADYEDAYVAGEIHRIKVAAEYGIGGDTFFVFVDGVYNGAFSNLDSVAEWINERYVPLVEG